MHSIRKGEKITPREMAWFPFHPAAEAVTQAVRLLIPLMTPAKNGKLVFCNMKERISNHGINYDSHKVYLLWLEKCIDFFLIIGLGENEVLYMTNYGSKK